MGLTEQSNQTEAIRYLAEYTETFRDAMSRMAVEYNANIITGYTRLLKTWTIMSAICAAVAVKLMSSANSYYPYEQNDWVIQGGDKIAVFETDAGVVGIQICYDVEFPERVAYSR